jgi:Glycosyl hydrolases family 35
MKTMYSIINRGWMPWKIILPVFAYQGGPIIMAQIENELGNDEVDSDRA